VSSFDPERLLAVQVDEGVEFVVVGGYAAVLHGASRPTEDVDVTPTTTTENLVSLTKSTQAPAREDPHRCGAGGLALRHVR
jgi:hypothetical protein